MKRMHVFIGLALTLIVLGIHLFILDDYGLTWDFHHHFFAGMHLLKEPIGPELVEALPFSEPDPRGTYKLPFGPLMSVAPVASYLVFFKWLGLLAFDNAYNLAIVVSGVAGIFILYLFLLEAFGVVTALAGFTFLALLPRYFGDLHNNMKDVPQAAAFTLAIWMFWRLVQYKRIRDLIVAGLAFAVAFNTKVNTVAVPIIAGAWVFAQKITNKKVLAYFFLAPLAAFLLWWVFWKNPVGQLLYIWQFFRDNTKNIEVIIAGRWYCSGVNVPWWYPLWYLAITTPLPILAFFLIGLIGLISQIRKNHVGLLLLLWFFIPLARYVFPAMGVIDGLRHFEEVVFPMTAIAAVGVSSIVNKNAAAFKNTILLGGVFVWLAMSVIRYHPFQISYYNELVGGMKGAVGKYDIDYWGGPQKQAMRWLNAHAPKDSAVYVVMAADVAGTYLRKDLRARLNTLGYDAADYVVVLNRQGFFYRYFYLSEYMLRRKTSYVVEHQGVPIVWVFDNHLGQFPREKNWWSGEDPCIRKYWE